jgi:uncharacterized protein (DUF2062 family)
MVLLNLKNKLHKLLTRFKELQGSPAYLARGVALGVFIGLAPVMPLKTVLIIALTFLFPASTIAAILACATVCNPLTYVPLYYLAWRVGDLLLPGRASWEKLEATVLQMQQSGLTEAVSLAGDVGLDTALVVLLGGCLLAIPPAIISYPLSYRFFLKVAKKRQEKQILGEKK